MSRFSRIMAAKKKKKKKIGISNRQYHSKFLRRGTEKKKIRKEKPKVSSLTWVMVFLVA